MTFPGPLQSRLTESPEALRLGDTIVDFNHDSAVAFAFIGEVVGSTPNTHPYIFGAVNKVVKGSVTPVEARRIYREYGVSFYPHIPSTADLLAYDDLRSGVMGENREHTRSGRAWKAVAAAKGTFSAVSFWARRAKVAADEIGLVVAALKLKSPIYVEFIDSRKPEPFQANPDEVKTVTLRSKVAPKLTPEQLIDVLVRGHIAPQSLTRLERAVVDEFRGTRAETKATALAGFGSAAERKFKTTIGDSLAEGILSRGFAPLAKTQWPSRAAAQGAAQAYATEVGGTVEITSGSNSMQPAIHGQTYFVVQRRPFESIKRDDLLVYLGRPNATKPDRVKILHRAVQRDRLGWIMSGDHNSRSETWDRVTPKTYLGTAVAFFEFPPGSPL